MDKRSFYDIGHGVGVAPDNPVKNISDNAHNPDVSGATISPEAPRQNNQGDKIMAEIVTGTTTGFVNTETLQRDHADIRREVQTAACDINKNVSYEGQENVMATKDARHDVITATEAQADRISAQTNTESDRLADRIMETRSLIGQRFHEVSHDIATVLQGQATLAKDIELNALKSQLDAAKNTTYLADKISAENEKTRDLINDLKYHDLNRGLVERNTALVECESDRNHWRYRADQSQFQGQWAQLQSQIQAFQSQLQETRQGLVNFGTMAGNAGQQSSTSNNVR